MAKLRGIRLPDGSPNPDRFSPTMRQVATYVDNILGAHLQQHSHPERVTVRQLIQEELAALGLTPELVAQLKAQAEEPKPLIHLLND